MAKHKYQAKVKPFTVTVMDEADFNKLKPETQAKFKDLGLAHPKPSKKDKEEK